MVVDGCSHSSHSFSIGKHNWPSCHRSRIPVPRESVARFLTGDTQKGQYILLLSCGQGIGLKGSASKISVLVLLFIAATGGSIVVLTCE